MRGQHSLGPFGSASEIERLRRYLARSGLRD
jgi:hypothetical protein